VISNPGAFATTTVNLHNYNFFFRHTKGRGRGCLADRRSRRTASLRRIKAESTCYDPVTSASAVFGRSPVASSVKSCLLPSRKLKKTTIVFCVPFLCSAYCLRVASQLRAHNRQVVPYDLFSCGTWSDVRLHPPRATLLSVLTTHRQGQPNRRNLEISGRMLPAGGAAKQSRMVLPSIRLPAVAGRKYIAFLASNAWRAVRDCGQFDIKTRKAHRSRHGPLAISFYIFSKPSRDVGMVAGQVRRLPLRLRSREDSSAVVDPRVLPSHK